MRASQGQTTGDRHAGRDGMDRFNLVGAHRLDHLKGSADACAKQECRAQDMQGFGDEIGVGH